MYEKYYGFTDRPFNLTPDSKFFFSSQKHEEALNCLLLSISERNGFVVITGDIGSGKTTVCRALINKLDPATKIALVLNTHLGKKELLTTVLEDLGIEYRSTSKTHLLSALNNYLLEQISKDINVVLVIDEAQNLTPSVLEEIRMLSNLETETEKLIQIVLMGQPELKKKLAMSKLEQFTQRIVFHYHLEPLDSEETKEYIKYRLRKAGNERADVFMEYAINEVYRYSKGVPRLINIICHNALITGLACESRTITPSILEATVKELIQWVAQPPETATEAKEIEQNTETVETEKTEEMLKWAE